MENALGNPLLNKYTREEVAQHASRESCWVVVHDTVYDMTHYMDKHPGGFDLLFKVAGGDATSDFEGMFHSQKARKILAEYTIGMLADHQRVKKHLNPFSARAMAMGVGSRPPMGPMVPTPVGTDGFRAPAPIVTQVPRKERPVMDHEAYRGFKLIGITDVNPSTKLFRFAIADNTRKLSISPGKHISVSAVLDGKFTKREYTPITDAPGYFELLIKKYENGPISTHIHNMKLGDLLSMRGFFGTYAYTPNKFKLVFCLAIGTGITPIYSVILSALQNSTDHTTFVLIYGSREETDILLKKQFDELAEKHESRFRPLYALTKPPSENWNPVGRIDGSMLKTVLEASKANTLPSSDKCALICGTDLFAKTSAADISQLGFDDANIHVF